MNDGRSRATFWGWLTTKAALFLGIVLLGGMAAGATAVWFYDSVRIEPGESDGHGNRRFVITEPNGEQTITEFLPEDSAFFSIPCDDDREDETVIGVESANGEAPPKPER